MSTKVFRQEIRTISPAEAREMLARGRGCGWRGCEASCKGDLPFGWVNLVLYWAKMPVLDTRLIDHWVHDKVLCPAHALALDQLLMEMPTVVTEPHQGEA
jgi:hypothetical protein